MRPTQRKYTEFWSNEVFTMYKDDCTDKICLISDNTGEKVENFYCAAFTAIDYRFWDKSELSLNVGQFIKKDSLNPATHKKFFIQNRFSKI
jgi:hypothetical protein